MTVSVPKTISSLAGSLAADSYSGSTLSFPMLMALLMEKALEANGKSQEAFAQDMNLQVADLKNLMAKWKADISDLVDKIESAKKSAKNANMNMMIGMSIIMVLAMGAGAGCAAAASAAAAAAATAATAAWTVAAVAAPIAITTLGMFTLLKWTGWCDTTDNTAAANGEASIDQSQVSYKQNEIGRVSNNDVTYEQNQRQNLIQDFQNFIEVFGSMLKTHAA